MRLIDSDALYEWVEKSRENNPHNDGTGASFHEHEHRQFQKMITYAPTLDAKLVKHEYWEDDNGNKVELDEWGHPKKSCWCSGCGEWLTASDEYAVNGRYCPNCGAKMDSNK